MVVLSIHTYANEGPNIWLHSAYKRRTSIVTPDTGHRTPDTGHRTPDTRHQTPDTRHRTLDTGHQTPTLFLFNISDFKHLVCKHLSILVFNCCFPLLTIRSIDSLFVIHYFELCSVFKTTTNACTDVSKLCALHVMHR